MKGSLFDWEGKELTPIYEDSADEETPSYQTIHDEKRELAAAKSETARLAAAAWGDMAELQALLGKLQTGTATRKERDRVLSVHAKLDQLKADIDATKTREVEAESKLLRSATIHKAVEVQKSLREKEIRSVIRSVCAAESVDLAFVVDCTGSMESYIAAVKENIRKVVQKVMITNRDLKLRMAVVGYRDIDDGSDRFKTMDFVDDVADFENFVGGLTAKGGGDTPEDIAGAIQQTNRLSWKNSTRVAFIVGDAPCHGSKYHNFEDSYPEGTPGISIEDEIRLLLSKRGNGTMNIYFGRITSNTDDMIACFEKDDIPMDVVNINDVSKFADSITSSVRRSIFKTVTATGGEVKSVAFASGSALEAIMEGGTHLLHSKSTASLKDYRIVPGIPSKDEWKTKKAVLVKVYRNEAITSINDLKAPIGYGVLKMQRARTDKNSESTMFMRRATEPFAEGEIRIAFYGQLAHRPIDLNHQRSMMVMKMFKHEGKKWNDCKQYLKQMEVSTIAHFLANEYNKSRYRPAHCARIEILQVCVIEEEEDINETAGNRRFCVESPLPGEGVVPFTKFSSNTGYWNEECLDETLLRFTEFTFAATDEYLMVTDLQGVRWKGVYYLTDPVILCTDLLRFGHTNLGREFMQKCIVATQAWKSEKGWCTGVKETFAVVF